MKYSFYFLRSESKSPISGIFHQRPIGIVFEDVNLLKFI